jgi:phospholipase/carboxylesterase
MSTVNTCNGSDLFNGDHTFQQAVDRLSSRLIESLYFFEKTQRQFDPGIIPHLRNNMLPSTENLEAGRKDFQPKPPPGLESFTNQLINATDTAIDAFHLFIEPADLQRSLTNVKKAGRKICRTQEILFPLRRLLPSVNRFFLEAPVRERADEFDFELPHGDAVGLNHVGMEETPYARSSFSLYVPESYDGSQSWPLVVALHGGFGHGRDFLWTWFREARSRKFLLLAPSSQGTTWSILGVDFDLTTINKMLEYVTTRWSVDTKRILLTGLSDGATYALAYALDENTPFTAYAPVSGVLPPFDLRHVRGRRIYWVHGALDWMFPVKHALQGYTNLKQADADVTLQVIQDLSHTYPREQNDRILTWFDPSLALPSPD